MKPRCQHFRLDELCRIKPCRKTATVERSTGTPFGFTRLCEACAQRWDEEKHTETSETLTCPQCGARLELDPCCVIEAPVMTPFLVVGRPLPRRAHLGRAVLCTRCEYCAEVSDLPEPDAALPLAARKMWS
jgi:hypothetical protein